MTPQTPRAAPGTHWYNISPQTTITCTCVHGKDHGDEGYNVPPKEASLDS